MMNDVEIELNSEGIRSVLQSPEMMALCGDKAEEMAKKRGSRYTSDVIRGKTRAVAMMKPKGR